MKKIRSQVIPLPRNHVDTDLIISAEFLRSTDKKGYGQHVFSRLRTLHEDFPFNLEKYQKAKILVTGMNFGCGSSREHAAWALADWGISVIIAPSFADIFTQNAFNNQIVPIVLSVKQVETILQEESKFSPYELVVDLESQTIQTINETFSFSIDPYRKECLLHGLDDFSYLVSKLPIIEKFEHTRISKPFIDTHVVFPHIQQEGIS